MSRIKRLFPYTIVVFAIVAVVMVVRNDSESRKTAYYQGVWDTCIHANGGQVSYCPSWLSSIVSEDWYSVLHDTNQFESVWPIR